MYLLSYLNLVWQFLSQNHKEKRRHQMIHLYQNYRMCLLFLTCLQNQCYQMTLLYLPNLLNLPSLTPSAEPDEPAEPAGSDTASMLVFLFACLVVCLLACNLNGTQIKPKWNLNRT